MLLGMLQTTCILTTRGCSGMLAMYRRRDDQRESLDWQSRGKAFGFSATPHYHPHGAISRVGGLVGVSYAQLLWLLACLCSPWCSLALWWTGGLWDACACVLCRPPSVCVLPVLLCLPVFALCFLSVKTRTRYRMGNSASFHIRHKTAHNP